MPLPRAKAKGAREASKAIVTIAENLDTHQGTVRRKQTNNQTTTKEEHTRIKEEREAKEEKKAKDNDI